MRAAGALVAAAVAPGAARSAARVGAPPRARTRRRAVRRVAGPAARRRPAARSEVERRVRRRSCAARVGICSARSIGDVRCRRLHDLLITAAEASIGASQRGAHAQRSLSSVGHLRLGVAVAGGGAGRDRLLDASLESSSVIASSSSAPSASAEPRRAVRAPISGDDVLALREHPRDRDLRDARTLRPRRPRGARSTSCEVARQVLALKRAARGCGSRPAPSWRSARPVAADQAPREHRRRR